MDLCYVIPVMFMETQLYNPNWAQSKCTLGLYRPSPARAARHNYFIEISQKSLNIGTKTPCGLHRVPWVPTTEYKLTWFGINWPMLCGSPSRARGTFYYRAQVREFIRKFRHRTSFMYKSTHKFD